MTYESGRHYVPTQRFARTKPGPIRTHRSAGIGNVDAMLMAALRDMQWRKRRFVIAVLSTAIIFAMTLVLTGLANGFRVEAAKTVDALGVDVFLVKAGASGPFVGATPFAPLDLRRIAATPGRDAPRIERPHAHARRHAVP